MKILMPYNQHPYTTANYVASALRRLGHDVVCWGEGQHQLGGIDKQDLAALSLLDFDLIFYVEGETDYDVEPFKDKDTPRVWWAIDNHLRAGIRTEAERQLYGHVHVDDVHVEISKRFSRKQDLILIAQEKTIDGVPYAPQYEKHGARVTHLPLAADISHHPLNIKPSVDVVFVGNCNWLHLRRRKLLDKLKAELGQERVLEVQAFGLDMVKALHLGKVVFNCSVVGDLNMRYWEASAAGCILVSDVGDIDYYTYTYTSDENAIERTQSAIEIASRKIRARHSEDILKNHTYDVRMRELLNMGVSKAAKKRASKTTRSKKPRKALPDVVMPRQPKVPQAAVAATVGPHDLVLKFPDEATKQAMVAHIANHSLFAGAKQPDGSVASADKVRNTLEAPAAAHEALLERAATKESLKDRYNRLLKEPSDINEHLPTLFKLASECSTIVELGLRTGVSTTALYYGLAYRNISQLPATLYSFDIDEQAVIRAEQELPDSDVYTGLKFCPRVANSLTLDLPYVFGGAADAKCVDMLFIDTLHTGQQLLQELFRHEKAVKHYIVLHDTETFGYTGEDNEPGLWTAVGKFLACNPWWVVKEHFQNNNGLTVLERCGS